MYAPLLAVAACVIPHPADLFRADVILSAPVGTADESDGSPRERLAILWVMRRDGACDAGVEREWFGPAHPFGSELDHARRILAITRSAPADDWLPPRAWFGGTAEYLYARATRLDADAATLRDWAEWNADRADLYRDAARQAELDADSLRCDAHRLAGWGAGGWAKPRRVVAAEVREWLGAAAWGRRELPAW